MSASILDRLNLRIAAEPALDHLDTLFVDLQDARDTIVAAAAQIIDLKDRISAPTPADAGAQAMEPASVTEAVTLLKDAKERLAVNALSDVGIYVDRSISLLGG